MRIVTTLICLVGLAACDPAGGAVGTGNFDGVPLDANGTTNCTTPGGEITSSGESTRQDLIRCSPQSQPLTGL